MGRNFRRLSSWPAQVKKKATGSRVPSGVVGRTHVHFRHSPRPQYCFNDLEYKTKFTINAMNYVASFKCFQQLHKLQKYDYFSILARNREKLKIVM